MKIKNNKNLIKKELWDFALNYYSENQGYCRRYFPGEVNRWVSMIEEINILPRGKVLDIGCGWGELDAMVTKMGFKAFAIDAFPRISQKVLSDYNIIFKDCLIEAEKLPFQDDYFDLVILAEVLEHFNYSPLNCFAEIKRVLKKDGLLVLTTPHEGSILSILNSLLNKSLESTPFEDWIYEKWRSRSFGNRFYKTGHHRIYTTEEVLKLLNITGYEIVKTKFIFPASIKNSPFTHQVLYSILIFLLKLLNCRFFANTFFVIAKHKK